jgi:hypothetical protein
MSQEAVAAEMHRLGHPWHQTTVAKTEIAGRPLRLNEVTDLARILSVPVRHLVDSEADSELDAAQTTLMTRLQLVSRLEVEIGELNQQVMLKTQALEDARMRLQESRDELARISG